MDPAAEPPPIELRLPASCLVVLVGAAGSGKSTFAARHFDSAEVLSSDAFRARIAGDPTDQRATGPAFAALHRALRRRLLAGRRTVVDATNVRPEARRTLLREAALARTPAVAVVLALDARLVLARNAARPGGLAVPAAAVERQLAELAASLAGGRPASEGFARVLVLREPREVEAVRVVSEGDGRP